MIYYRQILTSFPTKSFLDWIDLSEERPVGTWGGYGSNWLVSNDIIPEETYEQVIYNNQRLTSYEVRVCNNPLPAMFYQGWQLAVHSAFITASFGDQHNPFYYGGGENWSIESSIYEETTHLCSTKACWEVRLTEHYVREMHWENGSSSTRHFACWVPRILEEARAGGMEYLYRLQEDIFRDLGCFIFRWQVIGA